MGIKIIVYTHTDYKHVWPLWFGQTEKYLSDFEKIIFVNKKDESIPSNYKIITYDENDLYSRRVSSCLDQLDQNDTIIFHHEDMFLYDKPNFNILNEFKNIIKENPDTLIKLIRAGGNNIKCFLHEKLYSNPTGLNYSIQPTICKVHLLKNIYSTTPGSTIWEFEQNAGNQLNTLYSFYCYDGEPLRGLAHYDSSIYPYIATAIVKGQWNLQEYNNELTKLFNEYKINYI
jgi:hypothetical protein